jgi:hypothetical protein
LGVVTVTSTSPAEPAGDVAVIDVSETTVKDAAAVEPNETALAPMKPVPVIVTCVPPATGPALGLTPVTPGADTYVNASAEPPDAEVPPGVVTVMLTVPDPAGDVAVIFVAELTVNDPAAVDPNLTAVAPVKPVPVIVTDVPPPNGPTVGLMLMTAGTGSKEN